MKFFALIASLLVSAPAFAIIEARLTYGLLASSPKFDDLYSTASTNSAPVVANGGLGGDVLVFVPLTGWGFGLRQENLGLDASANKVDLKSSANRTALLVSYRFINTLLHVGTNFSYGISHSNSFEITDGNSSTSYKWSPDSASSYSAGVEVGVGLGTFVLGGELGYESLKWNKMKDSTGTSTNTPDIDMSGTYTKVYLGFGI